MAKILDDFKFDHLLAGENRDIEIALPIKCPICGQPMESYEQVVSAWECEVELKSLPPESWRAYDRLAKVILTCETCGAELGILLTGRKIRFKSPE